MMNSWRKKGLMRVSSIVAVLIIITLFGCTPSVKKNSPSKVLPLTITPHIGSEPLRCDFTFEHSDKSWFIDKLALFVSAVQLKNSTTDQWNAVELQTNSWQSSGVSLLWFDIRCNHDAPQNREVALFVSREQWENASSLRFEVSVPFALNHLNPMTQDSPLNIPEMFWTWQAGHKFFRLDLTSKNTGENEAWSYHLGSLGCTSASSLRAPTEPCKTPNRFHIEVPISSNANEFVFDIDSLLSGVQLNSETSCMFHTTQESSCDKLRQNWLNPRIFYQLHSESHRD